MVSGDLKFSFLKVQNVEKSEILNIDKNSTNMDNNQFFYEKNNNKRIELKIEKKNFSFNNETLESKKPQLKIINNSHIEQNNRNIEYNQSIFPPNSFTPTIKEDPNNNIFSFQNIMENGGININSINRDDDLDSETKFGMDNYFKTENY